MKAETRIPFNKPYLTGQELSYVKQVLASNHLSGNGPFTKRCQAFFEERYGFGKTFLTSSCTDALEMCAILADIQPGDEVIMPSYTFVSTANAFALRGARIRFADSLPGNPNIDPKSVSELVSDKTKAVVVVHYAGIACHMDEILEITTKNNLVCIEDAAQAIDSSYKGRPLGSLGDLAALSFHETKNIQCGQGGLAVVNNPKFSERAEYVWEKGTNRSQFVRGQVDKYSWVDLGSSYLPGEAVAALLWAQLEKLDEIQVKRRKIWQSYSERLTELGELIGRPDVPEGADQNGHLYYLTFRDSHEVSDFRAHCDEQGVQATTHYISLHQSSYYAAEREARSLPHSDRFTETLVRLPLFPEMTNEHLDRVVNTVKLFFKKH